LVAPLDGYTEFICIILTPKVEITALQTKMPALHSPVHKAQSEETGWYMSCQRAYALMIQKGPTGEAGLSQESAMWMGLSYYELP
jgi:hypothetical protein